MNPAFRRILAIIPAFALVTSGMAVRADEPPPELTVKIPAQFPEVLRGHLKMGGTNPDGVEINATSRFLTRGGKPWLPVMGEFHFSRYPNSAWEDELLKMKSGGIQIVATYFFWIHHEEEEGKFDWTGDRDIRRFVELCRRHGLLVYLRLGPWSHGECRNGGYPDWLEKKSKAEGFALRSQDPRYLALVRTYYAQMAQQIQGLRWKDGGPIIGGQVENELTRGPEYLLTLKKLAREVGLDFPLYSLTGWGGANFPQDELIPFFGFCLDNFWDSDTTSWDRSIRQNYFFDNQRDNDLIGMGLIPDADPNNPNPLARYPYLTCETGGGVQVSYTRRPYISGHDAAPLSLTKLGSGSNMPGIYMFHGGSNPIGKFSTMQESLDTGYPNDMPVISYDSQAPIREFGQLNDAYHEMRPMHLFLGDFGDRLAPMGVKQPVKQPANLDDTTLLRWAVRSDGQHGFIFINNYQRVEQLPAHENVRLHLEMARESLDLPHKPLTVPSGVTAIWPFNFDINGALLKYATAQPLCRLSDGKIPCYVFFATPSESEFAFDAQTVESVTGTSLNQVREDGVIRIEGLKPGKDCHFIVKARSGASTRILLLSRQQALQSYKANFGGKQRLFISPAVPLFDGPRLRLQSTNPQDFWVEVFSGDETSSNSLFTRHTATVSPKTIKPQLSQVKEAQPSQPAKKVRGKAQAPSDADFERAGVWRVTVPQKALDGVQEFLLAIDYEGDVARAYLGDRLIADDFYDGRLWEIGLKRFAPAILDNELTLKILPLRKDTPTYIASEKRPHFNEKDEALQVRGVKAIPVYEATLDSNDLAQSRDLAQSPDHAQFRAGEAPAEPPKGQTSSVVLRDDTVELRSPAFEFVLSTKDQLQAVSWKNRLTGRVLNLGNGPEVEFDIGLPGQKLQTPRLTVKSHPAKSADDCREAVFELASTAPAVTATVTYRWNDREPVLHKWVTIKNNGPSAWDRLLNVRLGQYRTDATQDDHDPDFPLYLTQEHQGGPVVAFEDPVGRKRGFPSYVEGQYFLSLAHPAGFALRKEKTVTLQQLPGARLAAGAAFDCMEAVYGIAPEGHVRQAFLAQLHDRMRRVRRGHDKPLAIFEPFGSKADGQFDATEPYLLDNLAKVDHARRESGLQWDYYSIEFWHDSAADLAAPNARNFPQGFAKTMREIERQGMKPGLWIDSGQIGGWTIADNPAVKHARTSGGGLCRATEPVDQMYREGYTHQIKENGVRLFKFDNLLDRCDEPNHEHLPGEYSTEPICNSIIKLYRELDQLCPDIVIMLYWRYQSPWWLEHADTLFDSGTKIEAASFAPWPAFRARDSVTRRLDQARWAVKDLPILGWDPLGVWLSSWTWNSCVGKEAWQTGMLMDICRGHLLAQLWSDTPYLTPPERSQAAEFIALLKARPECFVNSRFILGNPWRNEPYGYCCTDGRRAFLAINNGVFHDSEIELQLGPAWGLPAEKRWDIYRRYPQPAQLRESEQGFGDQASLTLRAMEIVLLEVVPHGESPTLSRQFDIQPLPGKFAEPTAALTLHTAPSNGPAVEWKTLQPTAMRSQGGAKLTRLDDRSILADGENPSLDTYRVKAVTDLRRITAIRLEALPDEHFPNRGPGRAENGNFTLKEFRLLAAPRNDASGMKPVRLCRTQASFSQSSHGGWPVSAAIDGKPETGWGINPQEGVKHEAVFELEQPLESAQGFNLEFQLDQAERGHNLGRFRLSATDATSPIYVASYAKQFQHRGEVPSTKTGGILAVSVELKQGPHPLYLHQREGRLQFSGTLDGKPAAFQPVVGNGWYPAAWQTWRLPVSPSKKPQAFDFRMTSDLPADVEYRFSAHFVPE